MTKRKRVDEVRWALLSANGNAIVYGRYATRLYVKRLCGSGYRLIRVRVTEVPKKKRSKKR